MKLTSFAVGALVGAVALWAWIFFGPASRRVETPPITQAGAEGETLESFFIDITKHSIAVTHNGQLPLAALPAGIAHALGARGRAQPRRPDEAR